MKRLFALVLASMLVCSTFIISTSAAIIISPQRPSQEEIIPDPDIPLDPVEPPVEPPVDIPDEPTPEVPSAPQTGYVMGIGGLVAAAAAAGTVAVTAGKKAFRR